MYEAHIDLPLLAAAAMKTRAGLHPIDAAARFIACAANNFHYNTVLGQNQIDITRTHRVLWS